MKYFIDYKYALDFLFRINQWLEKNPEISKHFLYKQYDLWQAYQHAIFVDTKTWSEKKDINQFLPKISASQIIKITIIGLFALFVTIISLLFSVISRPKISLYTVDKINGKYKNDFRLDSLYEALHESKVRYFEVVHTILGKRTVANFFKRLRPVIFLETIDFLFSPFVHFQKIKFARIAKSLSVEGFTREEAYLLRILISKYSSFVFISRCRVNFFRFFFFISGI